MEPKPKMHQNHGILYQVLFFCSIGYTKAGFSWLPLCAVPNIRGGRDSAILLDGLTDNFKENLMSLGTVLLIILILILIGAIPTWPHSRNWGYVPSGGLGLVVIILLVLLLTGRL